MDELNELEITIETIDEDLSGKEIGQMSAKEVGEMVRRTLEEHGSTDDGTRLYAITIKKWNSIYAMERTVTKIDQVQ